MRCKHHPPGREAPAIAAGALRRLAPPPWLQLDLPADSLPLMMMVDDDPHRHCSTGGQTRPWDGHRGCGGGKAVRLTAQLPGLGPAAASEPRVSGEADLTPAQLARRARRAARAKAQGSLRQQLGIALSRIVELERELQSIAAGRNLVTGTHRAHQALLRQARSRATHPSPKPTRKPASLSQHGKGIGLVPTAGMHGAHQAQPPKTQPRPKPAHEPDRLKQPSK